MYVLQMPDLNQELRETAHPHKQSLMESHLLLFYKKYNYHLTKTSLSANIDAIFFCTQYTHFFDKLQEHKMSLHFS